MATGNSMGGRQTSGSMILQQVRYVKSYSVRREYKGEVQYPPNTSGVKDAIDIHFHAHEGQQDPLALAQHASKSAMRGILYKTIVGGHRPAEAVQHIQEALDRSCESEGISPISC